jgi:hypothetical protein
MADKHTERALGNERKRHTDQARAMAMRIQREAGYILDELDGGHIPSHHLVADAVELERRMAALEAIKDTSGIYEAQLAAMADADENGVVAPNACLAMAAAATAA